MPVYHITLHAYRSWNADNPKGFIRKDRKGVQSPDKSLARARDRQARQPPMIFDPTAQQFLVTATRDAAARRKWDLIGTTATESHVHAVIATLTESRALEVQSQFKSGLGYQLAKRNRTKGRRYFSHGGAPERIKDRAHLRYLLEVYFPKHHSPMWCRKIIWKN